MRLTRSKIALGVCALAAAFSTSTPVYGTGCTETPPFVCTTTSESFFFGLMFEQPLQIIDFETLPNGQPSVGGTFLTPSFNYTSSGATFTRLPVIVWC